jgi:ATP-dependent DNA helicase RecQ
MARSKKSSADILSIAHKHFNYDSLRPGQEEAVRSLLEGRDTLVVQPTGAGKSAIYQIAGLMIEGTTVVISPLIALQKDQADSINSNDAAEAVIVNSQQPAAEHRDTLEKIEDGDVEYIFLAPEQLRRQETIHRLDAANVSLFVVDEAHCITEWGHDFRPDYLQIAPAIERLGHPTVLAMTATASREVRSEIVERLGMRDPKVIVQGFDRPNITLRVEHFETEDEKFDALIRSVNWADKPGIVYVSTRKTAERIMSELAEAGVHALFYHAGLKAKEREHIQEQFMAGNAEVIVATNAFGMGVDKADIRFVYHYDIPGSLDAYYQEIGRAGRDGEKAEAILFYRDANVGVQKFRTGQGKLETAQVQKVAEVIAGQDGPVAPEQVSEEVELSDRKVTTALHRLADVGAVELLPTGDVQVKDDANLAEAASQAVEEQQEHQDKRREKLCQMQEYAESTGCRREILLRYFGDEFEPPCHNCDNCEDSSTGSGAGTRREVA